MLESILYADTGIFVLILHLKFSGNPRNGFFYEDGPLGRDFFLSRIAPKILLYFTPFFFPQHPGKKRSIRNYQ